MPTAIRITPSACAARRLAFACVVWLSMCSGCATSPETHAEPDRRRAPSPTSASQDTTSGAVTDAKKDANEDARPETEPMRSSATVAGSESDAAARFASEQSAHQRAARAEIRRGDLRVGDIAPDFTLHDAEGARATTLSSLRGKPTVLVFGSCTCPPFVRSTQATAELAARYRDRVHFLMVYIREAHPTDGWILEGNSFEVATPTTLDERRAIARDFARRVPLGMPLVVDTIESTVREQYAPFPNRIYVLDAEGALAHIGDPGPQSSRNSARALPEVLDRLLQSR